jgi:arylformamidase
MVNDQIEMVAKYFDISPKLHEKIAVFPGDEAFRRKVAMSFKDGQHLDLSSITTTLHVGAHADAPSHYAPTGTTIEKRNLNRYIGPCAVVRVSAGARERIGRKHIKGVIPQVGRILFATHSFNDPDKWHDDFNSFDPALIEELAATGVVLIGIDTPSVDPSDSKDLPSHKMIFKHDMSILEGLILKDVPVGEYFLSALPLPIAGGDASPVRAVLWPKDHVF